jgi:uncharacterized protein (TIGR03435 family)
MILLVPRLLDSRRSSLLLVAACLALVAPPTQAQTTPPPAPPAADASSKPLTYDAVSIKPNSGGSSVNNQGMMRSMVMMRNLPDGFSATNVNLRQLIANAYDVKDDQIFGGPDWIGSKSYDIQAKVTGTDPSDPHQLTKAQRTQAMQALLADRFKLAVHTETKEASLYVLTVAKGGPKLTASKPSDAPALPPNLPPGAVVRNYPTDGPPRGGTMRMSGPGNLTVTAMTMPQFATMLSSQLHRTIVDQTGLTGTYDFTLQWTPDNLSTSPAGGDAQAPDPTGPTIYTAVQEQLGLKLESTKGPVKTVVIDHIEPPSEN